MKVVKFLVRRVPLHDAHHARPAGDGDEDGERRIVQVNLVIGRDHIRDLLLHVNLVQVHRGAVFLVVHAERGELVPGLDVVGGFDSGEVLVDDGRREPVEVELGGDAFDGDEPLNVAGLGPSRGADFVRLLDEVCAVRRGGRSVSGWELIVATSVVLGETTVGRKEKVSGNTGGSGTVGAPSAIMRTLTVLLSGLSATNTLPGHPGMSRGSAKS